MKTKLIVALLIALSASAAAPAFASGYGPAPFYRPSVGAPASQQGQNAQTLAAERGDATGSQEAVGGVASGQSQSASRIAATPRGNLFAHR
jgi:type IV secretory pathway TrbL component